MEVGVGALNRRHGRFGGDDQHVTSGGDQVLVGRVRLGFSQKWPDDLAYLESLQIVATPYQKQLCGLDTLVVFGGWESFFQSHGVVICAHFSRAFNSYVTLSE